MIFKSLKTQRRRQETFEHLEECLQAIAGNKMFYRSPHKTAEMLIERQERKNDDFFHPNPSFYKELKRVSKKYTNDRPPREWLKPNGLAMMCVREYIEEQHDGSKDSEWMLWALHLLSEHASKNFEKYNLGQNDKDEILNSRDVLLKVGFL